MAAGHEPNSSGLLLQLVQVEDQFELEPRAATARSAVRPCIRVPLGVADEPRRTQLMGVIIMARAAVSCIA